MQDVGGDGGIDRRCGVGGRGCAPTIRRAWIVAAEWGISVCLVNLLLLPLTLAMALISTLAQLASAAVVTLAGLVGRIVGLPFRAADALLRGIRGDKRRRD